MALSIQSADLNPSSSPACLPLGAVEMLPVYDSLSCVPRTPREVEFPTRHQGLLRAYQSPPDPLVNALWLWRWWWGVVVVVVGGLRAGEEDSSGSLWGT